ncbi:MAG: anthrone oxygenase family protein, partial [Pseudomonadota bacterium]
GLVAGTFVTFSDFVMRSLSVIGDEAQGMRAMQSINRVIYRSMFMVLFLGLTPVLGAIAYASSDPWVSAGAITYGLGVFGVTVVANVPMNQKLERMDADVGPAKLYWQQYLAQWTLWNHVRSANAVAATTFLLFAATRTGAG